jgi:hypothetical protein
MLSTHPGLLGGVDASVIYRHVWRRKGWVTVAFARESMVNRFSMRVAYVWGRWCVQVLAKLVGCDWKMEAPECSFWKHGMPGLASASHSARFLAKPEKRTWLLSHALVYTHIAGQLRR